MLPWLARRRASPCQLMSDRNRANAAFVYPLYASLFFGSHVSDLNRAVFLFLRFELFDERGDMRGDGGRKSVVLGLEALPNCRQPNAAVPSKNCLALRETVTPRSAGGRHTCRRRR